MSSVIERDAYFTSLPQEYYLSPEIYDLDIERVWNRLWLLAGHVSQIPQKGDFFTFELGKESLIITRGEGGAVNAFYNVCRHRGYRICDAGSSGSGRRITCPYHAWSYGLNGQLLNARTHLDGGTFDFDDFSLIPAQVEVWQGFILVNFADQPLPSIGAELAAADASFSALGAERMQLVASIDYPVAANWKLLVENILECYHCAPSHPELCQVLDVQSMHEHHQEWSATRPYDHSWMPLKPGLQSLTRDGRVVVKTPLGGHDGSFEEGFATGFQFQPSGIFGQFYVDHGITTKVFPVSPTESKLVVDWYINADAREGVDYDRDELLYLWDITTRQDIALTDGQQLGVQSSKYVPGPNSAREEPGIRSMLDLYLEVIGDASSALRG